MELNRAPPPRPGTPASRKGAPDPSHEAKMMRLAASASEADPYVRRGALMTTLMNGLITIPQGWRLL